MHGSDPRVSFVRAARRGLAGTLILLAGDLGPAEPVAALRVPPTGVPQLVNADVPLRPDGVLFLQQETGSQPFDDMAVEVRDASGALVPGAVEAPTTADGEPIAASWPGLWIWRPTQPFTAGHYAGIARNRFTNEAADFAFEVLLEEPPALALTEVIEVTLETHEVDRAPHSECCTRDDDVPPNCFAPHFLLGPRVRTVVDPLDPHPWLRQLLFYPKTDDPSADQLSYAFVDRRGPQALVQWRVPQSEHCVHVDVFDASSRRLESLPEHCFPNDPELYATEIEKTASALAGNLTALGCHQPPAGFEDAWCEDNQGHCFHRESLGCQHFEALCPQYPREPAPAVITANAGAPPSPEPDAADAGREPASPTRGASCAIRPAGSAPLALAALLALALLRRRRVSAARKRARWRAAADS